MLTQGRLLTGQCIIWLKNAVTKAALAFNAQKDLLPLKKGLKQGGSGMPTPTNKNQSVAENSYFTCKTMSTLRISQKISPFVLRFFLMKLGEAIGLSQVVRKETGVGKIRDPAIDMQ